MAFLLVFIRMTAMVLFNPALGRKNIPVPVKVGLSFLTALVITQSLPAGTAEPAGLPEFALAALKEVFIGFLMSFVMQMFLSFLLMAGEIVDLQLGVGMAKIYDPQSNVSMPISGSIFNLMFMLIFFAGNAHLTLIKILALSFRILPPGPEILNFDSGHFAVQLFASVLALAVKLALPVVAVELIAETGLGVLMRTVPQINVFVVGLQLKLLIGLVILALVMTNAANLFDSAINTMFGNIEQGLKSLT